MDPETRNAIITRTLQKDRYGGTREKLHKLLVERQIPFLSSTYELEIKKIIGFGGFGIVQLVRHQGKLYAHKRSHGENSKQRNSILEEAIKLTDVGEYHPNIQRLYFINLKTFGFLMDYCCCGSLESYVIDSATKYTFVDVLNWAYQLADALSFLHTRNIMHRDVKMQNILLKDNYHTLVLTDYGTATQLGRSLLTNQAGTPIIMAPEVCSSDKYTEKCDIYSWAIVFHQLLAKQHDPYGDPNMTPFALMIKVSKEKLRPRQLNNCPDILVALMYRAWHSDPNERPPLSFIKKVLRLILNVLPENKSTYSEEMISDHKQQWVNECDASEKHLLSDPRLHNEQSVHIYHDCLRKTKHILDMKRNIAVMEEKLETCWKEKDLTSDHYEQLLTENKKLQEQIEALRAKNFQKQL